MNQLTRYIAKNILVTIFITLFALAGLSAIIKFVDQLRNLGRGSFELLDILLYVILTIPSDIAIFLPISVLLGAIIALGNLATKSELIAMQAAGFSKLHIGIACIKTAIPLMLITLLLSQWGIPQLEQIARDNRMEAMYNGRVLNVNQSLWIKDENKFIYVQQINSPNNIANITEYQYINNKLQQIKHINQANFIDNKWQAHDISTLNISEKSINKSNVTNETWLSKITPDQLGLVSQENKSMSLGELYNYINFLESSGQTAQKYKLTFWQKIASPLVVAIMVLLALSFVFGPLRSVNMGVKIVSGISLGFVFYVANEILAKIGLVYNISPFISAITPSIMFLILSIYLLKRKAS